MTAHCQPSKPQDNVEDPLVPYAGGSFVGKLLVVGTPIGNLGDFSPRAREALETADAVLAEDTRVTGRLLSALNISKPLERLDENIIAARAPALVERITAGETLAFCSDAGMPALSDPGAVLIEAVRDTGLPVEVLPGPSAADTAFVASGCRFPHFYFGGFLPRKASAIVDTLKDVAPLEAGLIFFESPRRLRESLASIAEVFPDRRIWICRELTKLHEEVIVGTPAELQAELRRREEAGCPLKGEIALVIDGPAASELTTEATHQEERARQLTQQLLEAGLSPKTVASIVSQHEGVPKNAAYTLALSARA